MSERPRGDHRTSLSVATVLQRSAALGLALCAVALLVFGKADPGTMERFRSSVTDSVAPILDGLSAPTDILANTVAEARGLLYLHEENARLKSERRHLLHWQAVALRLEAENAALRRLLSLVPEPGTRTVSARVIADQGGSFAHSILLNGGRDSGIGVGNVVVTGEGVAGRIVGVADRSSRVLLVTDLNSRIPVVVSPGQVRGVLAGNNADHIRLIHVGPEAAVAVGDAVLTSGDAGAFPPGLPIGVVVEAHDGLITVEPFVNRSRLEFVRVVDYGLSGILDSDADSPAQVTSAALRQLPADWGRNNGWEGAAPGPRKPVADGPNEASSGPDGKLSSAPLARESQDHQRAGIEPAPKAIEAMPAQPLPAGPSGLSPAQGRIAP